MRRDPPEDAQGPPTPGPPADTSWPQRQVYFVTVEWLDQPHRPESPERLAQVLRHAIEHGHGVAAGTPPVRFVVRVKGETLAAEAEGTLEHHHHDPD